MKEEKNKYSIEMEYNYEYYVLSLNKNIYLEDDLSLRHVVNGDIEKDTGVLLACESGQLPVYHAPHLYLLISNYNYYIYYMYISQFSI